VKSQATLHWIHLPLVVVTAEGKIHTRIEDVNQLESGKSLQTSDNGLTRRLHRAEGVRGENQPRRGKGREEGEHQS
jgi:hypothetical protein